MKKYTAAAIRMNEITALMKSPIGNLLPLIVNSIAEKSGFPTMAAMNGVIISLTNAVTTAPNATPITTATARSRTLPRKINCLKPCNIATSPQPTSMHLTLRPPRRQAKSRLKSRSHVVQPDDTSRSFPVRDARPSAGDQRTTSFGHDQAAARHGAPQTHARAPRRAKKPWPRRDPNLLGETVDALCRAAEQLGLLVGRVAGGQAFEGIPQDQQGACHEIGALQ